MWFAKLVVQREHESSCGLGIAHEGCSFRPFVRNACTSLLGLKVVHFWFSSILVCHELLYGGGFFSRDFVPCMLLINLL